MKTKVNQVNVGLAEQAGRTYCSGKFSLKFFLFCLSFLQLLFINSNAQNRWNDSISASRRGCIARDARVVEEWTPHYGIAFNSTITGSGNGLYYCPTLFMHAKSGFISIGPTFQQQKMNFSGYQVQYEFNLLDGDVNDSCKYKRLELYTFMNITYQYNAVLSAAAQKEEILLNYNQKGLNLGNLRTIEAYAGFGMRVHLLGNLKMFGCIGFGGYRILVAPKALYHDKQGMGLILRLGVSYEFDKNTKTSKGNSSGIF